jgi:hypothetical protein
MATDMSLELTGILICCSPVSACGLSRSNATDTIRGSWMFLLSPRIQVYTAEYWDPQASRTNSFCAIVRSGQEEDVEVEEVCPWCVGT